MCFCNRQKKYLLFGLRCLCSDTMSHPFQVFSSTNRQDNPVKKHTVKMYSLRSKIKKNNELIIYCQKKPVVVNT